jgi:hypothetical protein
MQSTLSARVKKSANEYDVTRATSKQHVLLQIKRNVHSITAECRPHYHTALVPVCLSSAIYNVLLEFGGV